MGTWLIIYLSMFCSFSLVCKGQFSQFLKEIPEMIRDSATVTKDWEHMENLLKNLVTEGLRTLLPSLTNNMQSLNISSTCVKNTLQVIGGIKKLKSWAMRFLDSSGKSLDGMITGATFSYGAYDECLDTVAINERSGKRKSEEVMFTGKYCVLRIQPHLPPKRHSVRLGTVMEELKDIHKKGTILSNMVEFSPVFYFVPVRIGLCVPSGCTVDDINQLFAKVAEYTRLYMKVKSCEVKEERKYTPIMIIVMSIYSFAAFIVLLGTLTDVYFYHTKKKPCGTPLGILLAFSFVSNFRKFVDTTTSSKSLGCLNGIRFLTMSWVILGHTYMFLVFQGFNGLQYLSDVVKNDLAFQALVNASVSVDTFFFLGGFVVCYIVTKRIIIAKGTFSIPIFILHRLWRFLPVYIFVALFVFIIELVSSGPAAPDVLKPLVDGCRSNWWASLLFINNIYRPADACLPHTWYLAADMQLYIGSLIILLPLFWRPKVGISIAVVCLLGSMIASAVVTRMKKIPPTLTPTNTNGDEFLISMAEYYIQPYTHVGPYVIGIITGYFLAMHEDLKIPKVIQVLGWCFAIISSTSVLYGPHAFNRRDATFWEAIFYAGCNRSAWTLGVAWMVLCCATGHGGILNYILSWKLWIPLGRLTYAAYIVHFLVEMAFTARSRSPLYASHAIAVWTFFGHLMVSYGIAFVVSLLIEAPFLSLEKLILPQFNSNIPNKTAKDPVHALDIIRNEKTEAIHNLNTMELYKGTQNADSCVNFNS